MVQLALEAGGTATEVTVVVSPFANLDGRPAASRIVILDQLPSTQAELLGTTAYIDVTLRSTAPVIQHARFTSDLCAIVLTFSAAIRVTSSGSAPTCADIVAGDFLTSLGTGQF